MNVALNKENGLRACYLNERSIGRDGDVRVVSTLDLDGKMRSDSTAHHHIIECEFHFICSCTIMCGYFELELLHTCNRMKQKEAKKRLKTRSNQVTQYCANKSPKANKKPRKKVSEDKSRRKMAMLKYHFH